MSKIDSHLAQSLVRTRGRWAAATSAVSFAAAGVLDRPSDCIVPSWLGGGRPTITGRLAATLTSLRLDVHPTGPVLRR